MISNSGSDERGKLSGGQAGDQTGTEWQIRPWYNRPWTHVLRHPDAKVRELLAQIAEAAAKNNLIGYDQNQRYTYRQHLKESNWRPENITVKCEADCSSGVIANVEAVGHRLGNAELQRANSVASYTGDMRRGLSGIGFEVLTASKYLTSDKHLLRGDILLKEGSHTATNLTNGSEVDLPKRKINSDMTYTVQKGDTLSAIAKDLTAQGSKVTVNYLRKWNKLKSDTLKAGQKLKLYYNVQQAIAKEVFVREKSVAKSKCLATYPKGTKFHAYGSRVKANGSKWLKVWHKESGVWKQRWIFARKMQRI